MEFCGGGTLQEYVEKKSASGSGGVEEFVIWGILGQIAAGLKEMHSCDVLHLDLKPGNILIGSSGNDERDGDIPGSGALKIGDFGCATFLPVPKGFEREGDRTYIAPEVMESRYGKECDIFSLGLIIFEIATNIILPENGNHWQRLRRHDFSECTTQLKRVSPPLVELIKAMLHPAPEKRISLDQILGHPFVVTIMDGALFG
ncbi:kinase-like domain-containing protein [Obelidium mucronatum]|nr:kinase-like domain-containing protein [Obelidium mucronatum]KAI9334135.1 kinase-like domain-containing protein [Obelidium mucronatum]